MPPEAGRRKKELCPGPFRGAHSTANTLILYFWPPEVSNQQETPTKFVVVC